MAIDSHYIPAFSIEDVILDKDTGAPLSGGLVYFEKDNQRGVLKPVYQITGTSPNYSYIQLPNPMVLSSIGTFEDSLGNPVIPYFFPYDNDFDVELYYVRVESSANVSQFVREAVPYVPSSGNATTASAFENEISNPQFAQVLFDTSTSNYVYNFSAASNEVVNIAPDWSLVVSSPAAGTVTLSQTKPAGTLNVVSNPGTLLTINSAGLSSLKLRQRLLGSPNLWGSGYLSGTFVAKTYGGTDATLNMYYSQSNGAVIDQLLVSGTLDSSGNYGEFKNSLLIPASTSLDTFPTAYIDIYFDIPLSTQIDITSIMVAFTGDNSVDDIDYDQESLSRQIDHLYHYAYPIVPVGSVIDFAGYTNPAHYFLCDGTAYSRITYQQLLAAITLQQSVTLTSGGNTFTVASASTILYIGMTIEGNGVPVSTSITNIVGTTVTMSNNATITGASTITFYPWGNGDGSTTFNVPDLTGHSTAGANGSLYFNSIPGDVPNGVGLFGGTSKLTLIGANMPSTVGVASGVAGNVALNSGGAGTIYNHFIATQASGVAFSPGNATPFYVVQPTKLMRKFIRYE